MDSYAVEDREKELDIKQLLFYILDNSKWLIIVGIICGLLLGAYGYMKASKSDSPEAVNVSLQEIIKKNRTKWNAIDTSVTADAFNDPLPGTYIANAKVYVDFDYSNIEGNDNLDFSDMNSRMQGDVVALAGSNKSRQLVIDELNLRSYEDMQDLSLDDLRYMTNCGFLGSNIMQIQIVDTDGERAKNIANELVNNLIENTSDYESIDNISILEEASLIYSSKYEMLGTTSYIKNAIKYGVGGVIIGFVLVAGIFFLVFAFNDTVRTKEDIEFIGIKDYWIIHSDKGKKNLEIQRLGYSIGFLDKNQIYVVPVDKYSVSSDFKEALLSKDTKYNYKLMVTDDLLDNPEVILEAKKSDTVLLAAAYGKTRISNLELANKELKKAGIEASGLILTEARH